MVCPLAQMHGYLRALLAGEGGGEAGICLEIGDCDQADDVGIIEFGVILFLDLAPRQRRQRR